MLPMKKVEGCDKTWCDIRSAYSGCGEGCGCLAWGLFGERYFEVLSNPAVKNFFNKITYSNEKELLKVALDIAT
ncbi:hypothetical protein TSUD_338770 [Trifolium subterraneum]|nr:hypothetical protein TSUD_338770 [Trifolium subterraneum]